MRYATKYSNKQVYIALGMCIWMLASWFTHIFACLQDDKWGFLIAGAIVVPIAWIHGTGIWLGIF